MSRTPKPLRPGVAPTAQDFNAILRQAYRPGATATGDIEAAQSAFGLQIHDLRRPRPLARITSRGTGANYGWRAVVDNGNGTYTDQPTGLDAPWGTPTAAPAFELGGRIDVPMNVIVELIPGQQEFATFAFRYDSAKSIRGTPVPCAKTWLRLPNCATLTTFEQLGACACVPAQSAALTKEVQSGNLTSDTLLYGCPPGVLTAICDGSITTGAPRKWNLPVSGFTGGSTGFNGNYTLTFTSGESWVAVRSGITATAVRSGGGWTVTLDDGAGTVVTFFTASGVCCAAFSLDLTDDGGAEGAPDTLTMTPATSCGKGPAYTPVLSKVRGECGICRKLEWVPVAGSGARSILFDEVECGTDADGNSYIDFATDDPLLCTGTETECGPNSFVCRITCGPCTPVSLCGCEFSQTFCVFYHPRDTDVIHFQGIIGSVGVWQGSPFQIPEEPDTFYRTTVQIDCDTEKATLRLEQSLDGEAWITTYECAFDFECDPVTFTRTGCGPDIGQVVDIFDGSSCAAADPPPPTYVCVDGACIEVFDGSGASLASCQAECGITYKCIDGVCTQVFDGSGKSLAECEAECIGCAACELDGNTPSVAIPDGPNAGTYTGTDWAGGGSGSVTGFTVGGHHMTVFCSKVAGTANGISFSPGDIIFTDTNTLASWLGSASCGPPSVMTFPGTNLGSLGDVTVTT